MLEATNTSKRPPTEQDEVPARSKLKTLMIAAQAEQAMEDLVDRIKMVYLTEKAPQEEANRRAQNVREAEARLGGPLRKFQDVDKKHR